MAQPIVHTRFTYEEYLERERETGLKHEWLDGQIYAMSGGTPEHARLIAAVTHALFGAIDPRRCQVFSSELKVRVKATGLATYPDVAVVCGPLELDREDDNAVVNPTLLVEVLSRRTEAYDRGEKWAHYRQLPSLRAYVLVDQLRPRVEIYERVDGHLFTHRVVEAGQRLGAKCLAGEIEIDSLYASSVITE